jgi:hypothetical protein
MNPKDLTKLHGMHQRAVETHANAWRAFVRATDTYRAAKAKGVRVPYAIAQAPIDRSAAVERAQDRLSDLEGRIRRAEVYWAVA